MCLWTLIRECVSKMECMLMVKLWSKENVFFFKSGSVFLMEDCVVRECACG